MKTGLHLHGAGQRARIVDYYRRSGARTVKFMNFRDIGLMTELKAMGVTIIYRLHTSDQRLGGAAQERFISDLVSKVQGTPIDYAEGYNEAFGDRGEIGRYAAMEIDRMKALEAVGKKAIIGNFSLGTPEITDGGKTWEEFRPALRHAHASGHALGLHEYAGPYMQYFTETPDGRNQWKAGAFTGISTDPSLYWNPALTGWVTLRYRKVYALLKSWGLGDLALYITEGGIDDSSPRPGPNGRGYKDFQDGHWDALPGIGDYADQRRWYMWQVSHDPFVKGVVDFGWQGTSTGWAAFDLETDPPMVERIITREADLPAGHFGEPAPEPPPEEKHVNGIDVSRWQGNMDWSKAKAAGAAFAWIKASEGTTVKDPFYAANAKGAAAAGVKWGPYHFFNNGVDPKAQALAFFQFVAAQTDKPTLAPALDFEDTGGSVNTVAMQVFAEEVERLFQRKPIIYTAVWWWTVRRLGSRQAWAARLPLWLADYSPESMALPATGEWTRVSVLQHTSSGNGAAYGASSARIDLDLYYGDEAALVAELGYTWPVGIDVARLRLETAQNTVLRLNPDGDNFKACRADGGWPITNEWDFTPDLIALGAQLPDRQHPVVYLWSRSTGRKPRVDL